MVLLVPQHVSLNQYLTIAAQYQSTIFARKSRQDHSIPSDSFATTITADFRVCCLLEGFVGRVAREDAVLLFVALVLGEVLASSTDLAALLRRVDLVASLGLRRRGLTAGRHGVAEFFPK